MSIRTFILATAAAGGMALCTAGAAGASSGETAKTLLDQLCEGRGGMPVYSPYAIARCQGARANKGFESERSICEGVADGRLVVSISPTHMNRASWACIATSPVA